MAKDRNIARGSKAVLAVVMPDVLSCGDAQKVAHGDGQRFKSHRLARWIVTVSLDEVRFVTTDDLEANSTLFRRK